MDAEPIRAHIRALQADGLSVVQIAELSGVPVRTLGTLMYGNTGIPPSRSLAPATARALLAVRSTDMPTSGWLPLAGTQRRLRALVAIGWPVTHLAAQLGMHHVHISRIIRGGIKHVTPGTAQAVRDLYDQLWNTPGHSTRARARAARNHWPVPLAWDDDTIDNPTARPATARDRSIRRTRRSDDLWQSSEELRAQGLDDALIAERLDVTLATLRRARERAKARRRTTCADREQGVA